MSADIENVLSKATKVLSGFIVVCLVMLVGAITYVKQIDGSGSTSPEGMVMASAERDTMLDTMTISDTEMAQIATDVAFIAPAAGAETPTQPKTVVEVKTIEEPATEMPFEEDAKFDLETILSERFLGDENASVIMHEYSSLSCGHCSAFHKKTLPKIVKEYVDTGKLKIVYHDYPLAESALVGAAAARCVKPSLYFTVMDTLFAKQRDWILQYPSTENLRKIMSLAGLGADEFTECTKNEDIINGILLKTKKAHDTYEIRSTPTFIFNDGEEVIVGSQDFHVFEKKIEKLLEK